MTISYSDQVYRELKLQALPQSSTALDDAIETLRQVINQQFQSAGIRWTADLQLREAVDDVQRVCRQLRLERDITREQNMKLKEKVNDFEKKDTVQAKKTREQQSAMVQAIKVRAEKERKQLDRKYKLRLKEDEQKIFESAKAEYVKMNQELAEKMSDHLKQVESAYVVACQAHQHKVADIFKQFQCNYESISGQFKQDDVQKEKYVKIIKRLQNQISDLTLQLDKYHIRYLERPVSAEDNSDLSHCIDKLLQSFQQKKTEIQEENQRCHKVYIIKHTKEIEEINRKVKDIIELKDRKISQMKEAIDALNSQLYDLTTLPVSD